MEGEHTFPCLPCRTDPSLFVHMLYSHVSGGWGERGSEEGTFMCLGGRRTGWRQHILLTRPVLVRVLRGRGRGGKWGLTVTSLIIFFYFTITFSHESS